MECRRQYLGDRLSTLTIRDGLLLELFEGLVERSGAQGLLWMGRRLFLGFD